MDRRKLSGTLKELKNLAEDMDAREQDGKSLVKHFNNFLRIAVKEGYVEDEGLFFEATDKTTASEIMIDAALLGKYILAGEKERHYEVTVESGRIEEMEQKIRIKELEIEEKRLAQQEVELAMEAEELEKQAEELKKRKIEIRIDK